MKPEQYAQISAKLNELMRKPKFFIVGCQKSGTSWVQAILDAHPALSCGGESGFMTDLIPSLTQATGFYNQRQKTGPHNVFSNNDDEFMITTAILSLIAKWPGAEAASCIGERTPGHAILMPELNQLFPNSKFIHVIRDGRDVVLSGWFHNLREPSTLFKQEFENDFHAYIEHACLYHWRHYIIKARIFGKRNPEQYLEVRYEKLHSAPEETIEEMLSFLGVDASTSLVERCRDSASFENLSGGRKPGEEDRNSPYRKGIVGDWQNHFDKDAAELFLREAGTLMKELKYT
ncbi:MAG: hypothetical protein A2X49_16935 [Lentisphaerae bacterium GWF2_52_8]|nr:MAG: hypothetical protein A2X49_16935 [Lentisphaerae bacterium GWF2_52_8]